MFLSRVTLTGADDNTDVSGLSRISAKYPFVEWGILFSFKRKGTERYPSLKWIDEFLLGVGHTMKAIHLCGDSVLHYVEGYPVVNSLVNCFNRVQLNFNSKHYDGQFFDFLRTRSSIRDYTDEPTLILQYNENNVHLVDRVPLGATQHFLFDSSGGRGEHPTQWLEPLKDHHCGYAGGLGPENLQKELQAIEAVAKDRFVWIDMETNIRTQHRPSHELSLLDLDKCEAVLEMAKPYTRL